MGNPSKSLRKTTWYREFHYENEGVCHDDFYLVSTINGALVSFLQKDSGLRKRERGQCCLIEKMNSNGGLSDCTGSSIKSFDSLQLSAFYRGNLKSEAPSNW